MVSEADSRRRHAWLPGKRATEAFAHPGKPEKRLSYTMPGILSETQFGNPIAKLAEKQLGAMVEVRKSTPVEESMAGLDVLIRNGEFLAALDLSSRLLTMQGQGFGKAYAPSSLSEENLRLWTKRFQLLMALKNYELLNSEMEAFGDLEAPDLFFDYYQTGKTGSMIPFTLRLIYAELPSVLSRAEEALGRLSRLQAVIETMLGNISKSMNELGTIGIPADDAKDSQDFWRARLMSVESAMSRVFLLLRDYALATKICAKIADSSTSKEQKLWIYATLGKISLQFGDSAAASKWFHAFNSSCDQSDPRMKAAASIHRGFESVFLGNFKEAEESFRAALQFQPSNSEAVNNASVCILYQGRLNESINILEHFLRDNPGKALNEAICLNLSTLYDLGTGKSESRKQSLLTLVAQHRTDSFNSASLKLT